ncbi:MAG: hypothetical protein OHK0029_20400 [Armatimonadaceae bacterium]
MLPLPSVGAPAIEKESRPRAFVPPPTAPDEEPDGDDLLPLLPLPDDETGAKDTVSTNPDLLLPVSPLREPELSPEPEEDAFPAVADDAISATPDETIILLPPVPPVAPPTAPPVMPDAPTETLADTEGQGTLEAELSEASDSALAEPRKSWREKEDSGYRFPYSKVEIETVPDTSGAYGTIGTFTVRVRWRKGKKTFALFESTALRPLAMITLGGQHFPLFLNQQSRKRRDRVILGGKRKTAKSPRCSLRALAVIEGKEDRFSWLWRVAATSAAIEQAPRGGDAQVPDEVALYLPFSPGKARILSLTGAQNIFAFWMHDLVATIALGDVSGFQKDAPGEIRLCYDERMFTIRMTHANLAQEGVSIPLETWFAPAKTEAEARAALMRHAADTADRMQVPPAPEQHETLRNLLLPRIEASQEALTAKNMIDKRGMDRQVYRADPGKPALHAVGQGTDTALACVALLARFYMTGDDKLRRQARLLSYGVSDFQISTEESPHWGAIWDAVHNKKVYADLNGDATISVATTARAAKGLFVCQSHFEQELLQRTAMSATQWLLLKTDRDGFIHAERFTEEGPPVDAHPSPWIMAEAMIPFVETFRTNENEVFLKAAMRILRAIRDGVAESTLPFEEASCELLAAAVEGILMISREYESEDMISTAREIMLAMRVRRRPDGSLVDPPGLTPTSSLAPTLAGARAALALARVDNDPQWFLFALRALRAAIRRANELSAEGCPVSTADHTNLILLSLGTLLAVPQRVKDAVADRDRITIKKGWQTFAPDPATREYITVSGPDGEPVDHLILVCPVSLQVLISVIGAPGMSEVKITKNGRPPFVKGLLNGDYDSRARLIPLGDGTEVSIGVFLADT